MFFNNLDNLVDITISATFIYLATICVLRIFGKRASSKMNSFDWAVTVAVGSIISSTVLLDEVTIVDGITGIGVLHALQYLITWVSVHSIKLKTIIKSSPTLLFYNGDYIDAAMVKERVTRDEILFAVRRENVRSLNNVLAVILETDASLTVIQKSDDVDDESALQNVRSEDVDNG